MSFFEPAYHDPPDQTTLVDSLERMMKRLKFDEAGGATVLSHSNGTVSSFSLSKGGTSLLLMLYCLFRLIVLADCSRLARQEFSEFVC
jgi:hypothetical protein